MNKKQLHPGLPIVISAPSGSGKSTIAQALIQKFPAAILSISCTTRSPRPGEVDGRDYFFMGDDEFRSKIKKGEFLEWAEVHSHFYGTPASLMEKNLGEEKNVILTIDVQGALSVKRFYPRGVYIFLIPPTWAVLEARLKKRASDNTQVVTMRLANARKELSYLSHYDYLVVNDELERAVDDVIAIVRAEHCRLSHINRKEIPILATP